MHLLTDVTINQPVKCCQPLVSRQLIHHVVHGFKHIEKEVKDQGLVNITIASVMDDNIILNSEKELENKKVSKCTPQASIVKMDTDLILKTRKLNIQILR